MEKFRKFITFALIINLIIVFIIIFRFSSQDAVTSKGVSRKVTETVVSPVIGIDKLEGREKEKALSKTDSVVRKIAHFSLYMLVGTLAMGIFSVGISKFKNKNKIIFALLIGVIYAISDEIHQIYISGRTGLATDVLIDTMRCVNRNNNCINYNKGNGTKKIKKF